MQRLKQLSKLEQTKMVNEKTKSIPPQKELINFMDFTKLSACRNHNCSRKSQKNQSFTTSNRFGRGSSYHRFWYCESFCRKFREKVTVLTNLAPRKIRGVESQGMLLMSEDDEGNIVIVGPDKGAENGFPIA